MADVAYGRLAKALWCIPFKMLNLQNSVTGDYIICTLHTILINNPVTVSRALIVNDIYDRKENDMKGRKRDIRCNFPL